MKRKRQDYLVRATFRYAPTTQEILSALDAKDALRLGKKNYRGADTVSVYTVDGSHLLAEVSL